jgi:hypothetical protein
MASPVIDRYRRYKRGTDKLLDWLLESGKSIAKRTNATFAYPSKAILQTQELVIIADQICHTKPPHPVPKEILLVVADVIEGRTVCAEWYANLESVEELKHADIGKSNRSYRHFIDILKHVQRLLELATLATTSTPKAKARRQKVAQELCKSGALDLFAYLELEEPTAMEASSPVAEISQKVLKAKTRLAPRLDNDEEELSFALWCFFQDANGI